MSVPVSIHVYQNGNVWVSNTAEFTPGVTEKPEAGTLAISAVTSPTFEDGSNSRPILTPVIDNLPLL